MNHLVAAAGSSLAAYVFLVAVRGIQFPDQGSNLGLLNCITGSGRLAGEGIGYPFQHSWASLVAQLVKNLPAMRETWVQDPLEKGKATHSSILTWRIPWTVQSMVSQRVRHA